MAPYAQVFKPVLAVLLLLCGTQPAPAADRSATCEANVMAEITFTASRTHDDPFNTVTLDAVFTDPAGTQLRVPAFWAGGDTWKVRYASPHAGVHRFKTECSPPADAGLDGVTGQVEVTFYQGDNPLYAHGPLRVAASKRTLQHADGTPFFWLGDTWWMGLSKRLHWPDEVHKLAQDRKRKGFNVIQIVMGPPPDSHPFDPRSVNEAGFPWEDEYGSIRPEYYDAADERIMYLVDEGLMPCMFGMWGYHMRFMGVERAKQHWRYLIARYGALPVVWSVAGEANLSWYLAEGFPYDDREQVTRWTEVMQYLRETDPYRRLLTAHPTGFGWSARYCTDDPALLDFDMLQTPHGRRDAVDTTVGKVRESYAAEPKMPVINGEAAYEMLGDSLPTRWTRQMFWLCMTNGAAGHTYGANGIWQLNRSGDPHGPSPQHNGGVGYGAIPWDEAMNLPGSTHVALGKKLFEKYPWQEFIPHPEWAQYGRDGELLPPTTGQWIWHPEGDPTVDAPEVTRYFRKTFELPPSDRPSKATLWISADDRCEAFLNGERIGEHSGHTSFGKFDIAMRLRAGTNVLAIASENLPAGGMPNPAGLLATLHVQIDGDEDLVVPSDSSWQTAAKVSGEQWPNLEVQGDGEWRDAQELGAYGGPPWGVFAAADAYGPYATGIPGKVRIVYAPIRRRVVLQQLDPEARYRAYLFDVTTGGETPLGTLKPDEHGAWASPSPPGHSDGGDWVLVVEVSQ